MRLLALFLSVLLSAAPASAAEKPFRADAALTKAEGQIAEGKYAEALETLDIVMKRRPADADAQAYAAHAWMKLGDADKAALHAGRALKYDPAHLGAHKYRADLYLAAGDLARAREQMQALRLACGVADCAELNALRAELNAAGGKKED